MIIPCGILIATESALRGLGCGENTEYLLARTIGETTYLTPNKAFFQQFFSLPVDGLANWDNVDFATLPDKAPGVFRVVVFGESAAHGSPCPDYSFPRYLQAMLDILYPERRFEILNLAFPGINSYLIQAIAREARRLRPDLFIVYMGNNEGNSPYGPDTLFGRWAWLSAPAAVRLHMALKGMRLVQLGMKPLRAPRAGATETDFSLQYRSEHMDVIRSRFACNLADICESARETGAEVLLCTLGRKTQTVLRDDVAPGGDLPGESDMNRAVRREAERRESDGVRFVDIAAAMGKALGRPGASSDTFFLDLVHLTPYGNYFVARCVLDAIARGFEEGGSPAAPSPEICASTLGLSAPIERRILAAANTGGDAAEHPVRMRAPLHDPYPPGEDVLVLDGIREAARLKSDDFLIHLRLVERLLQLGQAQEALAEARQLNSRYPWRRGTWRMLGAALCATGDPEAGYQAFLRELEHYPDDEGATSYLKGLAGYVEQRAIQ